MDVDLVFKIAAIGILVAVLNILLSRAGRDEQALMDDHRGAGRGAGTGDPEDQRAVCAHQAAVFVLMEAVFRAMLIVVVAAAAAATVYKTVPGHLVFAERGGCAAGAVFVRRPARGRWRISFVMPSCSAICPASTPDRCSNA